MELTFLGPAFAAVTSLIAGLVWLVRLEAGSQANKLALSILEEKIKQCEITNSAITNRLVAIETKLDLLLDQRIK